MIKEIIKRKNSIYNWTKLIIISNSILNMLNQTKLTEAGS